jgi:hypothetical protein
MADELPPEALPPPNKHLKRILYTAGAIYLAGLVSIAIWQRHVWWPYPSGLVVGNLLASAIWAPIAGGAGVLHLDRLQRRHHLAHMKVLHRQHQEHLAVLAGTHKVVKQGEKLTVVPVEDKHA